MLASRCLVRECSEESHTSRSCPHVLEPTKLACELGGLSQKADVTTRQLN